MQSSSITLYAAGNDKRCIVAGDPIGRIEKPLPIALPRLHSELTAISIALAWCWRHLANAKIVTSSRAAMDMLLDNAGRDIRTRRLCRGIYRQLIDIDGEIVIRPRTENVAYGVLSVPDHHYRTNPSSGLVQLVDGKCGCNEVTINIGRKRSHMRNVGRNAPRW